jgi:hypothetical protein
MDDIRLPRHVIDRFEHRWENRLLQCAEARSGAEVAPEQIQHVADVDNAALALVPWGTGVLLRRRAPMAPLRRPSQITGEIAPRRASNNDAVGDRGSIRC